MTKTQLKDMIKEIEAVSNNSLRLKELLITEIEGLRVLSDAGIVRNLLNERKHSNYQQFREYFVQRVKPNEPVPVDSLLMYKDRPIYSDQPIWKPKDFDEYCMNTPLQNIEQ